MSFIASCLSPVASCFFYDGDHRAAVWTSSSREKKEKTKNNSHQQFKTHAYAQVALREPPREWIFDRQRVRGCVGRVTGRRWNDGGRLWDLVSLCWSNAPEFTGPKQLLKFRMWELVGTMQQLLCKRANICYITKAMKRCFNLSNEV